MPVSRKRRRPSTRRPSTPHPSTRRARPAAHEREDREVVEVSLRDLLLREPDEADTACLARALEAGARGDAQAALAHELSGTVIVQSLHRFVMQDLLDHGELAPAWAYSRWCLDLAYRSMLLTQDPRTDAAVRYVLATLYPESVERAGEDEDEWRMLGTRLAASDDTVQGIALFELGGLADYLREVAEPGLLTRTDRVHEWADASVGVYRLETLQGCRRVLRDLVSGDRVEVLNIGSANAGPGDALIGRIVPITDEPGLMFASHPMWVDDQTAQTVAAAVRGGEPLGWLMGLSEAMAERRLPEGFHTTPTTPFTSDLPIPEVDLHDEKPSEAGRIVELRAKGHSAEVANALGVLEVGLIAAGVSDNAAAAVAPHVTAALVTPGAFAAAQTECTGPDTADAWRILAGVVPGHLTERCLVLAAQGGPAFSP